MVVIILSLIQKIHFNNPALKLDYPSLVFSTLLIYITQQLIIQIESGHVILALLPFFHYSLCYIKNMIYYPHCLKRTTSSIPTSSIPAPPPM